ncbi:MAG: ComF family protein [Bacteroidales bacterium]
MRQWTHDITGFFFPRYCPVCGMPMHIPGEVICLPCELKMPRTNYARDPDNPVAQLFWGRIMVEGATSLFRFEKGSRYQPLLHLLKYKGQKNIGTFLGRMLGADLHETPFCRADFIIPVPLHRKKEKIRGFNQSEIIAKGVSDVTGMSLNSTLLFRRSNTDSQTRKNRFERWENMAEMFYLHENEGVVSEPTLLLIDDVVTTGSTLEACALALSSIPGVKLFVATVACA